MDSPKEVKKEKDDTPTNNASYLFRIQRISLPFGIIDLTSDDDARQVLTFRTNLVTPIKSTTTSRQNEETGMKTVSPNSSSSNQSWGTGTVGFAVSVFL